MKHTELRRGAHRRPTVYQSLLSILKKDLVPSQSQCSNKYTFIHDTGGYTRELALWKPLLNNGYVGTGMERSLVPKGAASVLPSPWAACWPTPVFRNKISHFLTPLSGGITQSFLGKKKFWMCPRGFEWGKCRGYGCLQLQSGSAVSGCAK